MTLSATSAGLIVTFLAPQGLSSESEASAAQVAALVKQIKADGVQNLVYGKPA